jgi:DNA-binding transcriptional LysR family regulator
MDPRRVLTFRAVAHRRSFSRAAEELALTQPAVSQQVAALEREVGAQLIDRRPGGLQLTAAGEVLLAHADAIADRLALAATQLDEVVAAERATLRIGAFPTALAALVPAAVARVREQAPQAVVSVHEGTSADLADAVASGDLHLAIDFQDAARPRREDPRVERRDLLQEGFLVALASDHRLARRRRVQLADLAAEGWTAASRDGLIVRACRAAGFEPRLVSVTRDQLAIRSLVERGIVVTLVPELLREAFHDISLRPIGEPAPRRDVFVLLPPGRRHPLAEEALRELDAVADRLLRKTMGRGQPHGAKHRKAASHRR